MACQVKKSLILNYVIFNDFAVAILKGLEKLRQGLSDLTPKAGSDRLHKLAKPKLKAKLQLNQPSEEE